MKRENGHAARETLGDAYWKDKRWKEVTKLRKRDKNLEANGLVMQIRDSWGV